MKRFEPIDVIGRDYILPSGDKIVKCDLKEDESFISIDGNIPEGFCNSTCTAIFPSIKIFRFGGNYTIFSIE